MRTTIARPAAVLASFLAIASGALPGPAMAAVLVARAQSASTVPAAAPAAVSAAVAAAATGDGVSLPPFERATLGNGAQIALMPKRDTPLVSMSVFVRGGSLEDPPGREGTASLLADLMQKGAGTRNAVQFAEAIEGVGGDLSVGAGVEGLVLGAAFLARDTELMVELASDALLRPRLAADEFDKVRAVAIQSLTAAKDFDPSGLIGTYGDAWLFRDHPYGRPANGSEESLATVSLEDLKRLHAAQVHGDRLIIVVVGDIDSADMKRRLEAAFGKLEPAPTRAPAATAAPRSPGRRVLLVDKPGAAQTHFWLGNVGASRTDPARTAQSVVNAAFGGRFTSMLNSELRVKSGLTYGAGASFDRLAQPGAFSISSFTKTETIVDAIDLALATLDRLHTTGLDAPGLASARTYLLGQFPLALETNGQLARRLSDMVLYGLGREDVDGYAARVRATDDAAARAAIANAFPGSDDLAIVLIGDATRIRDGVRKFGPVTEMRLVDPRFAPK